MAELAEPDTPQAAAEQGADTSVRAIAARYAFAVVVALLACALRVAIEPWAQGRSPYVLFVPATLLAVWYGGLGPGGIAAAIGTATGLILMSRRFPWQAHSLDNTLALASYLLSTVVVLGVVEAHRRARGRLEMEVQQRARSEERLAVTLRGIGDAVLATDERGRITLLNPVAERLTGWAMAEALGRDSRDVFRIVNEETREQVDSPVARVLRDGETVGLANHTILQARDGTDRPIDDSGAPIRDSAGRIIGTVLVFRDVTERRRAEVESLRLAAVVQTSDDAIIVKALDGRIVSWNPGAESMYGYAAAEAIGQSVSLLVPDGRSDDVAHILERVGRGESVSHFVTQRKRKDGRILHVSISVSALRDQHGEVVGASTIARDVTAVVEAEEAVRRSEQMLFTTLRAIGDAVVATDETARVTFMNPVAERLTGWSADQARGRDISAVMQLIDERTGDAAEDPVRRALAEGVAIEMQNHTALVARDGTRFAVEDSAAAICDGAGAVVGAVMVFRDVTERRRAEAERADTLEALAHRARLLDRAHVLVRDPEDRITFWNHGAGELYGYTSEEAVGQVSHALLQTEFPGTLAALQEALVRDGHWDGELVNRRRDGTTVIVASHQVLFRDDVGEPYAIVEVDNDVTALHLAEEDLRRERAAVGSLNERLQRAMAETHHRVKNNLQVIAALVDLQVMKDVAQVPIDELRRIGQHIRSLAAVHELLTQEAKANGEVEHLRTCEMVEKLAPHIEGVIGDRGLRADVEDICLPIRLGTALAVLINELVSNAVKHGTGCVGLAVSSDGDDVLLAVTDEGPGFPEGFSALAAANTGLDLIESVARWDLQGRTTYTNTPEGGACVMVRFPRPAGSASAALVAPPARHRAGSTHEPEVPAAG